MIKSAHTLTLSPETLEKLSEAVQLPNDAAINAFVADAINSYVQIGRLYQSGGQFQFLSDARKDPIVLHFPFQPDPRTDIE